MEKYFKIPRTISHYMLFMKWELDEVAIFTVPMIASMPAKKLFIGVIIGFILTIYYRKIKYGKPAGYLIHKAMKNGIIKAKAFPFVHQSIFFK